MTMINAYCCPACGYNWVDAFEGAPDMDCEACGQQDVSPHDSVDCPQELLAMLDKARRYDADMTQQRRLRETACCLWEHALTLLMENDRALCRYTHDIGTAELRTEVAALAESVDKAWAIAYKRFDYGDCFDWEFVPDLLNEFWGDDPANAQDDAFAWCKALSEILGKDEQLVRMLWQEEFGADLGE